MNKLEDTYVSYYYGFGHKYPTTQNLFYILTTDRFKDQVLRIRDTPDKETRSVLKRQLPSFTPSGRFYNLSASSLIEYSGFICIDIDRQGNLDVSDYDNLKDLIKRFPFIAYCGKSAGGNGYYCMVPIAYPDKHKQHFESLSQAFASIGITIDKACSSIAHKRFVSYDPEPYINTTAKIYENLKEEVYNERLASDIINNVEIEDEKCKKALWYIGIIEKQGIDITEGYKNWIAIGFALAHTFGEDGRELFHRVSQFHDKYNPEETDYQFSNFLKGRSVKPATIGTFLWHCRKAGLDTYFNPWAESENS